MPAKMREESRSHWAEYDGHGPTFQPPSFASSMDQAFRSFGQPGPNFGSLDDLMREVGSGPNHHASPRQPLWRHPNGSEGMGPRTGGSSSSSSSSSVRYENRGGGPGLPRSSLAQQSHLQPAFHPPPAGIGLAPEVRAADESTARMFVISLDVGDYRPEEIKVKTVDQTVVIEGRHEERRPDGSRYVSRNFSRSWTIPRDVEPEAITSKLSNGGVLTVEAPRLPGRQPDFVPLPVDHAPRRPYF